MSEIKEKSKKPIFKQWWFWIIIVVIIGIGGVASQGDKEATKVGENSDSSQKASDEKTEFKVGDIIAYDGKEITIKSIKRNYDSGNQFITPAKGKEYIKINIYIENKSDDKISYNTYDWELQDSDGDIQSVAMLTYSIDDGLGSGDLAKGGKKSGSLVFEVPKNDTGLVLHYKSSFWSDKTVDIKL